MARHIVLALAVLLAGGLLAGGPARAETITCTANLDGNDTALAFDTESVEYRSLRERWSPFAPECPSDAVLARLLPFIAPEKRGEFCLITDEDTGAYLAAVKGPGDRYGRCHETGRICHVVNSARDYTVTGALKVGRTVLGTQRALREAGLPALDIPTGAMILSEATGAIAGTLETAGTAGSAAGTGSVGIVSAPTALVGAAAGAVVIGGALLICAE